MTDKTNKKALIYCRVSDRKQEADGDGLHSQEHRCREYAAQRGYVVEKVFFDTKSAGGDFMSRPGMVALLQFLRGNSRAGYVVIFDDLKRFARDTEFHIRLRAKLAAYGATRECLNFKFEDTPEGKFIETIIAAQGELEREQNGRQVVQKMKARLERGFWPFQVPIGYQYAKADKSEGGGKVLVKNEPLASIIRDALEGYASGRFETQAEVQRFLEAQPEYPKSKGRNQITEILKRVIYAGYVEHEPWGVSLRKAQHEPLISFETHMKVKERMFGNGRAPQRKNLALEFPLRGFVACADCGSPYTSCQSKGRNDYYDYYLCHNRECASYGKSIRRETMEGEFEILLQKLRPTAELFRGACAMFEELWNHELAAGQARMRALKVELDKLKAQTERLLDRLVETDVPSVVSTCENRIRKLDEQKALVSERIANCGRPIRSYDESLRTGLWFLANPCQLWNSNYFDDKKVVLKLAFDERLVYCRKEGFRTANLSLPFRALQDFSGGNLELVDREGIEPSACRVRTGCSGPIELTIRMKWCVPPDSNRHARRHCVLSAACIPIPTRDAKESNQWCAPPDSNRHARMSTAF